MNFNIKHSPFYWFPLAVQYQDKFNVSASQPALEVKRPNQGQIIIKHLFAQQFFLTQICCAKKILCVVPARV